MTIVLIGPPAAGKTRLGKRLARRLGLPFVDTDAVVVAGHGAIADIFAEHGEPYFRALERAAVAEAVARPGIVSLGGGAVLDPDTQADLAATRVVLLTVRPEAIASRITNRKRPLVTDLDTHAPRVESFRVLRTNLQYIDVDRDVGRSRSESNADAINQLVE